MKRLLHLAAFLLLVPPPAPAQLEPFDESWRWVHFTRESGLPSDNVLLMAKSADGTRWVATPRGVAWYDDFEWIAVDSTLGLPPGQIRTMQSDLHDGILVLEGGRLYRGDRNGFAPLPAADVYSAVPLSPDSILVLAHDTLYCIRDGRVTPFLSSRSVVPRRSAELTRTADGRIWLADEGCLYLLEGRTWKLFLASDGPVTTFIYLEELPDGRGTAYNNISREVVVWSRSERPAPLTTASEIVQTIALEPGGGLLIAYRSDQVVRFRGGTWVPLPAVRNRISRVNAMGVEPGGDLWLATEHGLFAYRQSMTRWTYRSHESPDRRNLVNDMLPARNGDLWLAEDAGVEVVHPDGSVRAITSIDGVTIRWVTAVNEDMDGNIWIGSGAGFRGAYRWDGSRWTHVAIGPDPARVNVHRIFRDRKNRLWFMGIAGGHSYDASQPGAYVLDHGAFTRWGKEEGLLSSRVYSFAEGLDGACWFGTWRGLSRWKNGAWSYWKLGGDSLPSRAYTVAVDTAGRLWFSDGMHGLGYIDSGGATRYLTEADGIVTNLIQTITVGPDGSLWIGGTGGIGRLRGGVWSNFTTRTGLNNPNVWPISFSHDEVLVGTLGGGVNVLHRGEESDPPPRVRIAPPFVDHTTAVLRWAAFPFRGEIPAADVLTRYRIDDRPWSAWSDKPELTLVNAAYGEHTLSVQAKSLFGNVSAGETISAFAIALPFYRQPMFVGPIVALSGALILLGAISVIRSRRAAVRLLAYQKELQSLASRLAASEEEERRRTATFLHDDIGQTLALCKMKLAQLSTLPPDAGAKGAEEVRRLLDQMIQKTQSLTFELSPPVLYELEFADALEWLTEQMQDQHDLSFSFKDDGRDKPLRSDVRTLLYHAVRELLINVVKHADAGSAEVSLCREGDRISITVRDDGKGIPPAAQSGSAGRKGGFGLFNIRERLGHLGGRLDFASAPGGGTTVIITMPLGGAGAEGRNGA